MARWLLKQPHYINVPGTEWEYNEVDRTSGKQVRMRYAVPLYLDPNNPGDRNYPEGIIVAREGTKFPKDIVFLGEPTPDMEPLDEEAEAISATCSSKWIHPIESLSAEGGYGASLVTAFEQQIAKLIQLGQAAPANPVSAGTVSAEEFAKLQEQVAALMARNAELEVKTEPKASRRA